MPGRPPYLPFPIINGKIDRTPPPGQQRPNFTCPSEGHLGDATYRLLQSLPTEPAALLKYLKAGKKWTNDDPITEIGDLIREGDYDTRTGQVSGESAIIQQSFTERAGQLP